jgi:O-antigen/teichoic acid export membrane protein
MSSIEINKPIKFDRLFLGIFCVALVVTCLFEAPWKWRQFHFNEASSLLLYPLLSTWVLYPAFGIGTAMFVGTKDEQRTSRVLVFGAAVISMALFVVWAIWGFGRAFWWTSLVGVIVANLAYLASFSARVRSRKEDRSLIWKN